MSAYNDELNRQRQSKLRSLVTSLVIDVVLLASFIILWLTDDLTLFQGLLLIVLLRGLGK